MFVVWGTKIKRKRVGRVADFCPMCRALSVFELRRVGEASHVYYISFGQGKLLGHDITCETCGTPSETEIERYAAVSEDELGDLESVLRETYPRLREVEAERLALEKRVKSGALSPEERVQLLREPFFATEMRVQRQENVRYSTPLGRKISYLTLFLLVCIMVFGGLDAAYPDGIAETMLPVSALLFCVGFVMTLYYLMSHTRHFVRDVVQPQLAATLAPLRPTPEELQEVLQNVRSMGLRTGKIVKPHKLYAALEEAEMQSTISVSV